MRGWIRDVGASGDLLTGMQGLTEMYLQGRIFDAEMG
jgi:hypothetical protein